MTNGLNVAVCRSDPRRRIGIGIKMARSKWNSKNSWRNYHSGTAASIRAASAHDKARSSSGYGGGSKGTGGGSGGMDALTAFQNIMEAHGGEGRIVDECDPCSYYDLDELEEMAEIALGLQGIPWKNGIYDKDHDGMDFEEEIAAYIDEVLPTQIAMEWLDGTRYIPEDVCEWAFYEVSNHNK